MRTVRVEVGRGQAVETAGIVIPLENEASIVPQKLAGLVTRRKAKVDDVGLDQPPLLGREKVCWKGFALGILNEPESSRVLQPLQKALASIGTFWRRKLGPTVVLDQQGDGVGVDEAEEFAGFLEMESFASGVDGTDAWIGAVGIVE